MCAGAAPFEIPVGCFYRPVKDYISILNRPLGAAEPALVWIAVMLALLESNLLTEASVEPFNQIKRRCSSGDEFLLHKYSQPNELSC